MHVYACGCFVSFLSSFEHKIARQLKVRQTKANVEIFNKQNLGKINNNSNNVSSSAAIKSSAHIFKIFLRFTSYLILISIFINAFTSFQLKFFF